MNNTVSQRNYALGSKRSEIRELFEYGKKLAAEIGPESVYDFSLGNPSIPAPEEVKRALIDALENTDPVALHGYTSAQGDLKTRSAVADHINKEFAAGATADDVYMTCGAAASLTVTLNALACEGDEVILLAPYFPEYRVFVEQTGMKCVEVGCREGDFGIDADALEAAINRNTKAIIVNSPNNPTGAVYSESDIKALAGLLTAAHEKFGRRIYIIADEPYRELVYDGVSVPFIPDYYPDTIVCYSFSKSLSIPGQRIGYILVLPRVFAHDEIYYAVCGAGRALGYVCAPALFQRLVCECIGKTADLSVYKRNRDRLYMALTGLGYNVAEGRGAFYLFVKSPEKDARAFSERAKKYGLLIVASDSFGYPGYVRISYCVSPEMIERSLPAFKKLIEEYN
ncbi:MAG: pyridoxal phosphate-dependent aminotransferase [Clostridia bacterium]|nr:pyridoxal phosphate-dependent aminotransferase [Clostridia bacterium]